MNAITELTRTIEATCPIEGVSVGRWDDRSSWRIHFKDEATAAQRQTAQEVMDRFNAAVARAKAKKHADIVAAFEGAAEQLTAGYPPAEKLTWPLQEKEALAWQADEMAATPYIDALAAARGITRVDYLSRTLAKVGAFRIASAVLVGRRQKYEDQVKAAALAGDVAAIEAVIHDFTLA